MLRVARSIQLATRNWGLIGNANHETDVNTAGFTKLNYLQNSVFDTNIICVVSDGSAEPVVT